jgi:septal ring factor EnvC (AmiA/AmiB activator)
VKIFYSILLVITIGNNLYAQQNVIKDLEQQKRQIEKGIAYTSSLIDQTKEDQKTSMDNLNLIKKNIESRKELVQSIDKQLVAISVEISEKQKRIATLYDDLTKLKENYSKMVLFAYRNKNVYTQVMYILASDDLNQAYRRISYLKAYSEDRMEHARKINAQSDRIGTEISSLQVTKAEQEYLLRQKNLELASLDIEEKTYEATLEDLKTKERELLKELEVKKKQAAKLDGQIESAIAEEARREAERRREAELKSKAEVARLAANEQAATAKFERMRGKLPMPVSKGVVVTGFGIYNHPVLKGIKVTSNGIDISTDSKAIVYVVAEGVVRRVFSTGSTTSVLVQHGLYYTVYTHVDNVTVKAGDVVYARQPIALVDQSHAGDRSVLHFELWRQTVKQDPEKWLSNTFK